MVRKGTKTKAADEAATEGQGLGRTDHEPGMEIPAKEKDGEIHFWDVQEVDDNPYQCRHLEEDGDPTFLELVASIEKHGLRQIPTGRQVGTQRQMGDGHRRLRAFRSLQWKHKGDLFSHRWDVIPVFVQSLTDQEMADLVFEANEKRRDLNAIELANLCKRYMEDFQITQTAMAERRGMTQGALANLMRLLATPPEVQSMVKSGKLKPTHAIQLLRIKGQPEEVIELAKAIVDKDVSVRRAANMVEQRIQRKGRSLSDYAYPRPKWKVGTECKDCPHRENVLDWGDKKRPYCTNPECWDRKQAEAEQKEKEKVDKQAGKTGVVDLHKTSYDAYHSLETSDLDTAECEGCEHNKLAGYDPKNTRHYCFNHSCFRKKKTAHTKEVNKASKDRYEKMKAIMSGVSPEGPLPRAALLQLIDMISDYSTLKRAGKELGLASQVDSLDGFYRSMRAMSQIELRHVLYMVMLERRHDGDRYDSLGINVARLVAAMLPERYVEEFGALPESTRHSSSPLLETPPEATADETASPVEGEVGPTDADGVQEGDSEVKEEV